MRPVRLAKLRQRLSDAMPMPITHIAVRHTDSEAARRRRRAVVATSAVTGAGLLGVSLSTPPGSKEFYATSLSVAAVWTLGGVLSGPLHIGWIEHRDEKVRRPVLVPVLTGAAAFGFFYGAALVAKQIPLLDDAISRVLEFAEAGEGPLVLFTTLANGVGEEIFFRGAMYAALDKHEVAATTAVYALATCTTRNPSLVLAASTMGTLWGLQRRASGGLAAPVLTHLTWSTLMVRYLPPLFRRAHEEHP